MGGIFFWGGGRDRLLEVLEMCVNNFELVCNVTEQRKEVSMLRESLVIISFR